MSKWSLALHNLRGFAMLMVVAVHSAKRFAKRPSRVLAPIADNAFGIYFFHFGFALWLQHLLLDLPLLAAVKFAIVCTASLILSWLASATVSRGVLGLGLLPERRSALANWAGPLRESR